MIGLTQKKRLLIVFCLLGTMAIFPACNQLIVPEEGYDWPSPTRAYWPTQEWQSAPMEAHRVDAGRMAQADQFAGNDPLTRCLLVIKDGYIVFEKYYGGGAQNDSSNLWSVTKSFTSALVGIAVTQGYINNVEQPLTDYLPEYPAFGDMLIRHALTHTTGLNWQETGRSWVQWISSPDWIAEALSRGQINEPGEEFLYSSANSQFLSGLIRASTGLTPGELAQEHLFTPLGIPFQRLTEILHYANWDEYKPPLDHSWRQDTQGLETGGFCLYLTAREMAKLGFLYINRGQWEDRTIVRSDWVE